MTPAWMFLALVGCYDLEPVIGGTEAPKLVVRERASVELDSVIPTDLLVRADGTALVLDGYAGRILAFGPDGAPKGAWASAGLGRPVRIADAQDGGVWAAVPGLDGDPGLLLHLDAQGAVTTALGPTRADGAPMHPVDMIDLGAELVVADREGDVVWINATTGVVLRTVSKDVDRELIRRVVDLAEDGAGGFLTVDTLGPRVRDLSATGIASAGFGETGMSVGRLARPTAVAVVEGARIVSDAVLGAVQAFEPDGDIIGVFANEAGPIAFGHPVAVRASAGGVVVLDALPARVRWIDLDAPLPAAPLKSLIRTTLIGVDPNPAGAGGTSCLQCHDGLMLDSREVWDPARKHHPVNIEPESPLPEIFRLDDEGKLVCTSCHSPHGVVAGPEGALAGPQLVRHQSASSPFQRLDKDADALCLACHTADEHVDAGSGVVDAGTAGHPTGAALTAALKKRKVTDGPSDPTKASCLSCHAMHGATGEHITRDPGDGATCLGCHPAVAETSRNHALGRVPGVDLLGKGHAENVSLAADGGIGCLTCHDVSGDRSNHLVRRLDGGAPVCLDCHTGRKDLQGSPHARLTTGGTPTCVACHTVHGGDREATFLTATAGNRGDPSGCLACHGPGKRAAKANVSPGRAGHPVDGRALVGEDPLTCLSCHAPHEASVPTAADCATCHTEQGEAAKKGGHGTADCLDCHPAHSPTPVARGVNPASARCLSCHAPGTPSRDATKLDAWEHPIDVFDDEPGRWQALAGMTLYDPKGKPALASANGALTCQSCHLVHGPNPAGDDNLRSGDGWKEACAACHGNDALVLYRYFHRPQQRQNLIGGTP